jgi:Transposase DDE domain
MLWKHLLSQVCFDPEVSLIDSFPVPTCHFARAYRCRILAEESAFGYNEMSKQTFYGLRAHLRVCWPGVIVEMDLAPARTSMTCAWPRNCSKRPKRRAWVLGDRNYWSPELAERLSEEGLSLLAPYKSKKREGKRWPKWLVRKRRRIETVISQMTERYRAKRVWARDRWHLTSRWLRKVLSHTMAVYFCQQVGISPLRFAKLLTD